MEYALNVHRDTSCIVRFASLILKDVCSIVERTVQSVKMDLSLKMESVSSIKRMISVSWVITIDITSQLRPSMSDNQSIT